MRLESTPEVAALPWVRAYVAECSLGLEKRVDVDVRSLCEIIGTSDFNEVTLDGLPSPAANAMGEVGADWRAAMSGHGHERSVADAPDDPLRLVDATSAVPPAPREAMPPAGGRRGRCSGTTECGGGRHRLLADPEPHRADADAPLVRIAHGELNPDLTTYAVRTRSTEGCSPRRPGCPGRRLVGMCTCIYAPFHTITDRPNEALREGTRASPEAPPGADRGTNNTDGVRGG